MREQSGVSHLGLELREEQSNPIWRRLRMRASESKCAKAESMIRSIVGATNVYQIPTDREHVWWLGNWESVLARELGLRNLSSPERPAAPTLPTLDAQRFSLLEATAVASESALARKRRLLQRFEEVVATKRARLDSLHGALSESDAQFLALREAVAKEKVLIPVPSAAATTLIVARIVGADSVPLSVLEAQLLRIAGRGRAPDSLESFLRSRSAHFALRSIGGGGAHAKAAAAAAAAASLSPQQQAKSMEYIPTSGTTVVSLSYNGAVASNDVRSLLAWCGDGRRRAPNPRSRRVAWLWRWAARFSNGQQRRRAGEEVHLGEEWRAPLVPIAAQGAKRSSKRSWRWCAAELWILAAAAGSDRTRSLAERAGTGARGSGSGRPNSGSGNAANVPSHAAHAAHTERGASPHHSVQALGLFDADMTSFSAYREFDNGSFADGAGGTASAEGGERKRKRQKPKMKIDPMRVSDLKLPLHFVCILLTICLAPHNIFVDT